LLVFCVGFWQTSVCSQNTAPYFYIAAPSAPSPLWLTAPSSLSSPTPPLSPVPDLLSAPYSSFWLSGASPVAGSRRITPSPTPFVSPDLIDPSVVVDLVDLASEKRPSPKPKIPLNSVDPPPASVSKGAIAGIVAFIGSIGACVFGIARKKGELESSES
jgi:hypothetical protein